MNAVFSHLHRHWTLLVVLLGSFVLINACRIRPAPQAEFKSLKLKQIDDTIQKAIGEGKTPGGVFWLERHQRFYSRAYGQRSLQPVSSLCEVGTLYDLASLTKVMATTPSILLLVEQGSVDLEAPVYRYLPEFAGEGREKITLRQLLTHTSGLRAGLSLNPPWQGYDHAIKLAGQERVLDPPGTVFRYSDINFVLLGEVVRRVGRLPLDQFARRHFYQPLRLKDTGFLPPAAKRDRLAPTELSEGQYLQGTVHDPLARRMGGVAGHAGLFSTAEDVARFARMMLNGGSLDGVRVLKPETVKLMTTVQTPPDLAVRRGLGWDIDSGYSRPRGKLFPLGSFGHTGWTGTCIWIDPGSGTFWLFLSNRVHPDGKGNILGLQSELGTLAAEAIAGYSFMPPSDNRGTNSVRSESVSSQVADPAALVGDNFEVLNGIDVLQKRNFAPLKGLRIGLITNHTGRDRQRRSTIQVLHQAPGVILKALFSPEHGLQGNRDELVGDNVDAETGLPIYSLYGKSRQPSADQLQDLDALVFDIQDIGCRFYTYISTLGNCLEAAAKARKKFIVLDRINPINGLVVDGPVLSNKTSFIAWHPIPVRHGMTVGELARLFNAERGFNADLTIVPLEGWRRSAWFDQTGLPWINPSPNMRSLTQAALYPGIGLLETTRLSVGRGTDTPFEVIGAPYIDDVKLAGELNRSGLAGVRFVPVRFVPSASVYSNQPCAGVNIILTQRERYGAVEVGLTIAQVLHRLYPQQFDLPKVNTLLGHPATLDALAAGKSLAEVKSGWASARQDFERRRQKYLLYNP